MGGSGMRVIVVRHGIAQDRDEFAKTGQDDGERPLTKEGRRKMREAAAGLRVILKQIDVLASSPLVRAKQTAEIVREVYGGELAVAEVAALEPAKPVNAVLHWLQGQPGDATVALIGHEPQLSTLVSWLLSGEQRGFIEMRKGSACLLEFDRETKAGGAKLLWMLKPSHLRDLG